MMKNVILLLYLFSFIGVHGQDDLMNLLDTEEGKQEVLATFKGTRIILGHSIKMRQKKELEFLIIHRFGRINSGLDEFFGLDGSSVRLSLEYGISKSINVGLGRSSFDKTVDAFLKYKLFQQSTGTGSFPLSIVLFNSLAVKTTPTADDDPTIEFSDRLATAHQLLIARKVNAAISLQLMPTIVYKQLAESTEENTQIAIGVGGRIKLTQSWALTSEYYYRLDASDNSPYTNSFSIGFDIETGGHVFQLHFTNSIMTVERAFITETQDDFFRGDVHFGFNVSRTFNLSGRGQGSW